MPRPSGTCAIPARATPPGARPSRLPATTTSPSRRTVPETARSVVVLPAPFAPSSATISPSPTVSETRAARDLPVAGGDVVELEQRRHRGRSFSRVVEVEEGIRRITFALPFGIDHVHCYLLRSSTGGWILVDTGLGSRDPEARWRPGARRARRPVERIVVTHMHPDHVGGARDIAELTGAPVLQGREDYEQCVARVGPSAIRERFVDVLGVARDAAPRRSRGSRPDSERLVAAVHWVERPAAARRRRRDRRLARRSAARARRRPHRPLARRRDDRGRHDPRRDHAGDRPLSELAPRSARRLPRDAATGSRSSRRASPTPATRIRSLDPAGRARARSEPITRERLDARRGGARRRAAARRTTSRWRSSPATCRRRCAASRRPRRSRTSSGSCTRGGPPAPGSAYVSARPIPLQAWSRFGSAFSPCRGTFASMRRCCAGSASTSVEVRKPEQLDGLDGLVIPGGESTTFMRLMRLYGLDEAIRALRAARSSAPAPG